MVDAARICSLKTGAPVVSVTVGAGWGAGFGAGLEDGLTSETGFALGVGIGTTLAGTVSSLTKSIAGSGSSILGSSCFSALADSLSPSAMRPSRISDNSRAILPFGRDGLVD